MVKESNQWMETSDWKVQIEASLRDALAASILAALADMRRGLPSLEAGRGWQSGPALHEREDFRDLVSCVDRGITSVLRFLSGEERISVSFNVMFSSYTQQLSKPRW